MDTFERSLAALRKALLTESAPPLTGDIYTRTHARFEAVSTQRAAITEALVARLSNLSKRAGRPLKALSVGCGDGTLDLAILRQLPGQIQRLCGLDSNPAQLEAFRSQTRPDEPVELYLGDTISAVPVTDFDAICAIHMIYYVEDERGFTQSLLDACAPGGEVLLAVTPKSPMNEIADLFWRQQGEEVMFADAFAAMLERSKIAFERHPLQASIPLSHYVGDSADQDVIDFTVQAECAGLSSETKDLLTETFKAAQISTPAGPALDHPVDIFKLTL